MSTGSGRRSRTSSSVARDTTIWPPWAAAITRAARFTAGAEVVTVAVFGRTGVHSHANAQRVDNGPPLGHERALRVDGRVQRVGGCRECRVHAITGGLHHETGVPLNGYAQDLIVASQCSSHGVCLFFPQPRRAFQVGEQEGHGP